MSTFRWCTGYIHPVGKGRVVHLLSSSDKAGSRCPGSYQDPTKQFGYTYCRGIIVVPTKGQMAALHATWKLGGYEACAQLMETFAGATVQRPAAGWGALDAVRRADH